MTKPNAASSVRDGTAVHSAAGPVSSSGERVVWRLGDRTIPLAGPVVVGIVNLTPDSFSDGGRWTGVDAALRGTERMIAEGADLIDVGGESTRPGAAPVSASEETDRILPFLKAASKAFDVPLCVDTRKSAVAEAAVSAGAVAINDVSGLRHDPRIVDIAARTDVGLVLMHMRGEPATMRGRTDYTDLLDEVAAELGESVDRAVSGGVDRSRIVLDPGIGFAKTAAQSLVVLRDLGRLLPLGYPLMVGPSRKSFLGAVLGLPVDERLEGTVAACVASYLAGARIFRVHDVGPVVRALLVARAIREPDVVG